MMRFSHNTWASKLDSFSLKSLNACDLIYNANLKIYIGKNLIERDKKVREI